ncbi:hypothetical protein [Aeromicrobium wangtongii]|uniref:DUF2716 domain-containing protein n=1 Tax=Aeromicrobium wangtongii TaxID=2969247 RepID=A0ABY5M479_9ACTN|nr:hypothetical protein [Aeromicrobium wangtongii]MCD9198982.1 hypothetical protein [Aeromicrobium wangtongii]UUP12983.1 hypothetical protein NQV15_14130 [Aeromicrobium wangtongii]
MSLTPLTDVSAADWFVDAPADQWTKICLGPPGYAAYARLHLVPADDEDADDGDIDLTRFTAEALRRILPRYTATPDDCFFGQWEGSGWEPPTPPALQTFPSAPETPGELPWRRYHLYSGSLQDSAGWDGGDPAHLMWPADRAWFVAKDVDPDWVAVAGSHELIDQILAEPTLAAAPSAYQALDWDQR